MNKFSIENAKDMSSAELVELILKNVPFNNIRNCLANLEKEVPEQVPDKPSPVEKEPDSLDNLRTMCSKYPILIVSTNQRVPKKAEPQVVYYARSKTGDKKFTKRSMDVSKFNIKTCSSLGEEIDENCNAINEWIEEQKGKGVRFEEIKRTVKEYLDSGMDLYLNKCGLDIKTKLGITGGNVIEEPVPVQPELPDTINPGDAERISRLLTPNTDFIIYPKDRKGGKVRVAYYSDVENSWVTEDKDIDFIKEIVSKTTNFADGTPDFVLRMESIKNTSQDTPKYRNLKTIISAVKEKGIKMPYNFIYEYFP